MVPRGLRLNKKPTTTYSPLFQEEWNNILTEGSLALMSLIIKYEAQKLLDLQKDIEAIRSNTSMVPSNEEYQHLNGRMDKNIEKLELSIMQLKKSKFQRDLEDYSKGVVYNWHILRKSNRRPKSILKNSFNARSSRNMSHISKVSFDSSGHDVFDTTDEEIVTTSNIQTRSSSKGLSGQTNTSSPPSVPFLGAGGGAGNMQDPDMPKTGKKKLANKGRNA